MGGTLAGVDFLWLLGLVALAGIAALGVTLLSGVLGDQRRHPLVRLASLPAALLVLTTSAWLLATFYPRPHTQPTEQVVRVVIDDKR
jgi:H+/Cl- antiporter ClcA